MASQTLESRPLLWFLPMMILLSHPTTTTTAPSFFRLPRLVHDWLPSCVFVVFHLVGAFQGFKLDNGIPPNHHLSNIRSVDLFRFFQDHIQKGIVASQDSNQFAIPIQ